MLAYGGPKRQGLIYSARTNREFEDAVRPELFEDAVCPELFEDTVRPELFEDAVRPELVEGR